MHVFLVTLYFLNKESGAYQFFLTEATFLVAGSETYTIETIYLLETGDRGLSNAIFF